MTAASPLHPRHSVVARCAASARRAPCPTAEGVGSMRREELNDRLSRITTCWTVLRQAHQGSADAAAVASPADDPDAEFLENWRDELLARTWQALAEAQPTFFTVLHFRAARPDLSSAEMAQQLGPQLGKPVTPEGARQTLRRAREMFADLLLDEVAHSLEPPVLERVEEELRDLN